ncbi:MAG: Anaerobic nitric oxide reductase transcription regulator NorR [Nitrospirae bacterium]|nr:Anaerobic nitric oxide reductase transcription regulator NorR [Nitrospirota bacterium]
MPCQDRALRPDFRVSILVPMRDALSPGLETGVTDHRAALLQVAEAISLHRDLPSLFRDLAQRLPAVASFDFIGLVLHDQSKPVMRVHVLETAATQRLTARLDGFEIPMEDSASGWVWEHQQPMLIPSLAEETRYKIGMEALRGIGVQSVCFFPLTTAMRRLGAIGFGSTRPFAFSETDVEFLNQVAKLVAVAVDNVLHDEDLTRDRDRLRLLLEVTESIASHHDQRLLLADLAKRLPQVVPFDFMNVVLHDSAREVMRLWLLVTSERSTIEPGLETPVDESPGGLVWKTQQPLTVDDVEREQRFPALMALFRENGVRSFCVLPLTTAQRRLGAMGFGSLQPRIYLNSEITFMKQVAQQVAVALDNALNSETSRAYQAQLTTERDRQRLLLEVNNAVVAHLDLEQLFPAVSACLRRVIQHDGSSLLLCDAETGRWRIHVLDFTRNESFIEEGEIEESAQSPSCLAITTGKAALFGERDLLAMARTSPCAQDLLDRGVKSFCSVPLLSHNRTLGALNVGRRNDDGFSPEDVQLLGQVAQQVSIAVENALAYREIAALKDKLAKEKVYLEEEIQTSYNFEEIVGESRALKQVLKQVQTVAATDSTVLILGETGSGKELIARALHNLSTRRERTFVKLNCAAIPTGLLESELFGHERGAFTGAIATKIGRFELADRGTIFLDEVGEIPLELQVKLLRMLQEQEFERLGSTRTMRVNVRVIAATNRDLAQMVEEQRFRSDLYYRLKVFPITVPPLRERADDIPLLVRHFVQKFASRMKKRIETVPTEAMRALQAYAWPGNVRELENFVERAVILSSGSELFVSTAELKRPALQTNGAATTLEEAERDHILKALRETHWVIGGATGAAARLGMKRTTLQSKMQKLGIARPR